MGKSLTPAFSISNVMRRVDRFRDERIRVLMLTLAAVGETFANNARTTETYKDRTGNLRGSIGYVIVHDGKIQQENLKGTAAGKSNARKVVGELIAENNEGLILIGFVGMEYAAAVESKGYDVISGSVPVASILLKSLKEELGL